jgi:hypothetical protein
VAGTATNERLRRRLAKEGPTSGKDGSSSELTSRLPGGGLTGYGARAHTPSCTAFAVRKMRHDAHLRGISRGRRRRPLAERHTRDDLYGPIGVTARTFRDPQGSNRVGVLLDIPDMAAFQKILESEEGAAGLKHDGVHADTLLFLEEA